MFLQNVLIGIFRCSVPRYTLSSTCPPFRQLNKSLKLWNYLSRSSLKFAHPPRCLYLQNAIESYKSELLCGTQAVRTCYHNNLVTESDVSRRNVYDNDIRRIQCVSFIFSLGMVAVAACPGVCFLRDKAAVLGAENRISTL
jgi:hypothetical protein